ncbi:MAG: MarR family transcriptional regulator [Lentisphaeria bacterium]|nr:MarR family transcriptional regulator [Candidatus Neomarinimicrobiota bacterium]MCF7842468.1 MarR family transcriptional regulator [Lentisphaeria bacterium]
MEKEKVILDAMRAAAKPLKAGDVAELTGIPKDEVSKIFNDLKKSEKIVSPKRCFYQVK